MRVWRALSGGLLAALLAGAAAARPAPGRVVSLNPCLDGILLEVADPGQIAALSHYSRNPAQSAIAAAARRYPFTWGSAEEVVALRPDLVLTSGMGAMALTGVLPGLHVRQVSFTVPQSVEESLAQVRRVATLVGHPDRGEALAARIRAAIAAAAPKPGEPRLDALIYEYHGIASGPRTLVDELMRQAGFDNRASTYGLRRTGDVPLEQLVANPPQVLLAGRLAPGEPVWADRVLSHPALAALAPRMRRETFPETLMFCGGPSIIPAIAALALAREDALAGRSR
ncbi:MAG TPA: ABC transporter substrate-binding protein [Caulobacteraceae bacterium]|nr:ABC transporter substrate-binding protein [Caulobacteraceae bacterium]